MRLDERESLTYIKKCGYTLSRAQFYRIKKNIRSSRFKRLCEIAKGFVDHHLERLETLDLINYEMWKKYREKEYKAMDALQKIAQTQQIISQYYDISRNVMEYEITKRNDNIIENDSQLPVNNAPPKSILHIVSEEDINGVEEVPEEDKKYWHNWVQCFGCKRYWRGQELLDYHKRMSPKTECTIPNVE